MKQEKQLEECTPTWQNLVPIMIDIIKQDNKRTNELIEIELMRMAKAADQWNEHLKKLTEEPTDGIKIGTIVEDIIK